jgi:hypothetical protein
MSHISKIELKIKDLQSLKEACRELGFKFQENQKSYKWYGRWVGDSPLPEGITEDQLGICDHAIKVPGALYEVGIVSKGESYILLYDDWIKGGLKKKLGVNAGLLKQAYEYGQWLLTHVLKDVPHRQWVFSIPKRLRIYFLFDWKLLAKLSICAWKVIKTYLTSAASDDSAVPGASIAVQTYGVFKFQIPSACHFF